MEITASAKEPDWTRYATGPGAGIQLASGRLVVPCDHIEAGSKKYYSHVLLSDDGGLSWRMGGSTPEDQVNECEVVELKDGSLLARENMTVRLSDDEGKSWPHARVLHPGPAAYSCLAALPDGRAACLYECGQEHAYEHLRLARFDLDWLRQSGAL